MDQPISPRQTQTFLRQLFQERGLRPRSKLGQNFLIDLNLLEVLVQNAEVTREDLILEVGTGTGSLTGRLADLAGLVLSVEIDPDFFDLARRNVRDRPNLQLFNLDILKNKNEINPGILEKLRTSLSPLPETPQAPSSPAGLGPSPTRFKLVANLPYVVATPVISNFLLLDLPLERMVVTVQWEMAERLMALPGTKEYGALAVLVQSLADVELVRKLPPAVFWPRPEVSSAILRIQPNPGKRALVPDVVRLRHFLRDLYSHRRKNLRGALAGWPGGRRDKGLVDARLAELGLDGQCRAETLDVQQHLRLCEVFATDEHR